MAEDDQLRGAVAAVRRQVREDPTDVAALRAALRRADGAYARWTAGTTPPSPAADGPAR